MDTLKKLTSFLYRRNTILQCAIPHMLNRNLGKHLASLAKRTVVQTPNATLNGCFIQKRSYKPYTILPKKYHKVKDRTKDYGHDVYFLTDQALPRCTPRDAISTLKAYDLFGPEHVDFLLQVNMENAKVCMLRKNNLWKNMLWLNFKLVEPLDAGIIENKFNLWVFPKIASAE